MKQAEEAIENTAQIITEWNENAVRQIVERVTVLSADEVLVRIKGGAAVSYTHLQDQRRPPVEAGLGIEPD